MSYMEHANICYTELANVYYLNLHVSDYTFVKQNLPMFII